MWRTLCPVLALILIATLLFSACAPLAAATASPSALKTVEPTASPMPAPTETLTPTETPSPAPTSPPTPSPSPSPTANPTPSPAPTVEAGAPDAIGLYLTVKAGRRERLSEYKTRWIKGKDIGAFNAFTSKEEVLKGDYRKVFVSNWQKYPRHDEYKIGYRLSFTLKSGETVTLVIRSPKDAPKDPSKYFYQFIEVYLYDGINIKGWYSHLVESKMKKNTLMTYIKITAGKRMAEVESARLGVFVFKGDADFDPVTGEYIGAVYYEIPVINTK